MAITGIFTRSRPNIGGFFFDATLEEGDELQTDVTRFPIETGEEGNDHAVTRNLRIFMLVALSDNPVRSLAAQASEGGVLEQLAGLNLPAGIISAGVGLGVGRAISALPSSIAALAGLGASIGNASFAAGQAGTRSASALEAIRGMQRREEIFTLATSKGIYPNCIITNTRRTTNPRNENGLELMVEMEQLRIMNSSRRRLSIPAPNDSAAAQATPYRELGTITVRPLP